jgi:hypothetical protein
MSEIKRTKPFGDYALLYYRKGFFPIPTEGKVPQIVNWNEGIKSEDECLRLSSLYSRNNIGILTGEKSQLCAVDFDLDLSIEINRDFLDEAKRTLPKSEAVKVGKKGFTLFYRYNPSIPSQSIKVNGKQVLDFLSDGRQCVVSPSIHPDTNKQYRWEGKSLLDVDCLNHIEVSHLEGLKVLANKFFGGIDDTGEQKEVLEGRNNNCKELVCRLIGEGRGDYFIVDKLIEFDLKSHSQNPLFMDDSEHPSSSKTMFERALRFVQSNRKSVNSFRVSEGKEPIVGNKSGIPDVLDSTRILKDPITETDWLVDELVPKGGFAAITGRPKTYKSTFARNLCLAVSRGEPFLGFPVKRGRVIYFAIEEKEDQVRKHLIELGLKEGDDLSLVSESFKRTEAVQKLRLIIAKYSPELVVIDPLVLFANITDCNNHSHVYPIMEEMIKACRLFNVAILFLHHSNKGGHEGSDGFLGSTALFGSVDAHIKLFHKDDNLFFESVQRYGKGVNPTSLILNEESRSFTLGSELKEIKKESLQDEILGLLEGSEVELTRQQILKLITGRAESISAALKALVNENKITQINRGGKGNPMVFKLSQEK